MSLYRLCSVLRWGCASLVLLMVSVIGCQSSTTGTSTTRLQASDSAKATTTLEQLFVTAAPATRPAATQPAKEQINSEAVMAFFQAKSAILEKDDKGAIEFLERSVALDKNYLPARSLLTKLYFEQGQVESAESHARVVLSLDPNDPTANYVLGSAMLKGEDFRAASRHLYLAMNAWNRPNQELSLEGMLAAFKLGSTLAARGYLTAALEILRPLLEQMDFAQDDQTIKDPRIKRLIQIYRPGIYLVIGELSLKLNHAEDALACFRRAQNITTIKTQATMGIIRSLSRLRKDEEARKLLDRLSSENGIDDQVLELYHGLYPGNRWADKVVQAYKPDTQNLSLGLKIAESLHKSGSDDLAGSVLQRILQIDPSNSQAFSLLVRTFEQSGKVDQAARVLIDSVSVSDGKSTAMPMALKSIDANSGRRLIRALMDLSVPAEKEYARQFLVALSCQTAGETRKAGTHFRACLQSRGDFLPAYLAYGQFLLQERRWKNAVDLMDRALDRKLKTGGILYILGSALMEWNDIGRAITTLEQAKELTPNSDQVLLGLAECYLRSTDASKAFDLLKQIIGNNLAGPATMSRLVQMLLEADSIPLAETVLQQYGHRFGQDDEYRLLAAKLNFTRNLNASEYRRELIRLKNSGYESGVLDREMAELEFDLGNYSYVVQLTRQMLGRHTPLSAREYQRIVEIQAFSHWRLLDYPAAEQAWQTLMQTWPNHRMLQSALARMYVDAQDYRKGVPLIESLLKSEKTPDQVRQIQLWLIKCLKEQRKTDEAIARIDAWLPTAPKEDRPRLMKMKVECLLDVDRTTDAIALLNQLLTAKEPPVPQWQHMLVSILLDVDQANQANASIDQFLAGATKERHLLEGLKVTVLLQLKRYDDAVALARQMVAKADKERKYSATLIMINSLQEAGRYDQALTLIQREMAALPPNSSYAAGFQQQVIRTLELAGRVGEAERILLDQIAKSDSTAKNQWQQILVALYFSQGKNEPAVKLLEGILAVSPNLGWANNSLGYSLADTGRDLNRAETLIRKALTTEPGSGSYLDSLAWALFKQGKTAMAYRYAMMAYRVMDEPDPVVLDHLGDICLQLQKMNDARGFWRKAAEACKNREAFTLEPGMPERSLKKLEQLRSH